MTTIWFILVTFMVSMYVILDGFVLGAVIIHLFVAKNNDVFFFSSRRRHPSSTRDWSSDVCSSDLRVSGRTPLAMAAEAARSALEDAGLRRSEERRVGKECRSRGSPYHEKKKEVMRVNLGAENIRKWGIRCVRRVG